MQDDRSRRSLPLGVVAGFAALTLATGSAVAWWSWNSTARKPPAPVAVQQPQSEPDQKVPFPVTPDQKAQTQKSTSTVAERTLQVYWLTPDGDQLQLAPEAIKLSSTDSKGLLQAALSQLMKGPEKASVTSAIPESTQVRSVAIREDGIHVDLSQEFETGGGSTAMIGRVAQVLYTATSLNPDAQLWLSIEGKPLETLGGEGLVVEQPLTRQSFEQEFSF